MNKQNMVGFTLVELLIVLAIVSILASIAIVPFSSLLEQTRAHMIMHQLAHDIADARHRALVDQVDVMLCPRSANNTCGLGADWSKGWLMFRSPNHVFKIVKLSIKPNQMTFHGFGQHHALEFRSNTLFGVSNGSFTFRLSNGEVIQLIISKTGRSRVEKRGQTRA